MSYAQDEAVVEPFGQGYYICTGSDTTSVVFIAMTTNNSLYQVNSSGGQAWANATIAASNYVYQYYGGNDIELSWSSASAAMAWVNGYQGVPNAPLYVDVGSAGGCPDSGYSFGNSKCNIMAGLCLMSTM
jgi:hypothetical protein